MRHVLIHNGLSIKNKGLVDNHIFVLSYPAAGLLLKVKNNSFAHIPNPEARIALNFKQNKDICHLRQENIEYKFLTETKTSMGKKVKRKPKKLK